MEWIIFHRQQAKEVYINARLITYYHSFEEEGPDVTGTLLFFMNGTSLRIMETVEEVTEALRKKD